MRKTTLLLATTVLGLSALACSGSDSDPGGAADDILPSLQAIEGLTVEEKTSAHDGYRYFVMELDQPADHDDPDGQRFQQRMTLLHRSPDAPMVLVTSGYGIFPLFQLVDEPTQLLAANQIWVEHRFFTPSRPDPASWAHLTIEQAAADDHRIVEAISPLYQGKWISTGRSKGGMAALYHRRFYPDDVDGTVPYVAPHSYGTSDPRYVPFVDQVGDAACRTGLQDFQREVLLRRPAMVALMEAQAADEGMTYDLLGEDKVLDICVIELPFAFWQYFDASLCATIPTMASADDDVWKFLDEISPPSAWSDDEMLAFEPYYWQSATQLGYPGLDESHIADLLLYPGVDVPSSFVFPGPGKDVVFDPAAMMDVAEWLDTQGSELLFVYGENDPWSAGAFELGGAGDSFRFFAPAGNHRSGILDLDPADRDAALGALEAWTGVKPMVPQAKNGAQKKALSVAAHEAGGIQGRRHGLEAAVLHAASDHRRRYSVE